MQRLLGLDLVDRLDSDLDYLIARSSNSTKAERLRMEKRTLDLKLVELNDQLANLHARLFVLCDQEKHLKKKLGNIERELAAAGGNYAKRRPRLQQRLAELKPEIEATENTICELTSGLLPFALSPNLCKTLEQRLNMEEQLHRQQIANEVWRIRLAHVETKLQDGVFWNGIDVSQPARDMLTSQLLGLLQFPGEDVNSTTVFVHHLSEEDHKKLKDWIGQAVHVIPERMELVSKQLRRLRRERDEIQNELNRSPVDEVLAPIHSQILQLETSLRQLRRKQETLQKEEGSLSFQVKAVTRDLGQVKERLADFASKAQQARLAGRVQRVLGEYRELLLRKRITALEEALVIAFNGLCRKERLLARASIDPETYHVSLQSAGGHIIGIDSLSAGEHQLYALALLQALRQVSGRPLPLVIDTPLARLDEVHRPHVLDKYFPQVSRQVLLFATEMELSEDLMTHVRPYLCRRFTLSFDSNTWETRVVASHAAPQFENDTVSALDGEVFV